MVASEGAKIHKLSTLPGTYGRAGGPRGGSGICRNSSWVGFVALDELYQSRTRSLLHTSAPLHIGTRQIVHWTPCPCS